MKDLSQEKSGLQIRLLFLPSNWSSQVIIQVARNQHVDPRNWWLEYGMGHSLFTDKSNDKCWPEKGREETNKITPLNWQLEDRSSLGVVNMKCCYQTTCACTSTTEGLTLSTIESSNPCLTCLMKMVNNIISAIGDETYKLTSCSLAQKSWNIRWSTLQ